MNNKLSARQVELLRLIGVDGLTHEQAGKVMGRALGTVNITITIMREKLGAKNAAHMVYLGHDYITGKEQPLTEQEISYSKGQRNHERPDDSDSPR